MTFDPILSLGPFMSHEEGTLAELTIISNRPRMRAVDDDGNTFDIFFPSSCRVAWVCMDLKKFINSACKMPTMWRIKATVSKVSPVHSNTTIVAMQILVDRANFNHQKLHIGYVAGEYELSMFLLQGGMASFTSLPNGNSEGNEDSPGAADAVVPDWDRSVYLMPHQVRSVHLMRQLELRVHADEHTVPEWAPVPITPNHSITSELSSSSVPDIPMIGGILANDIGSGKTAVVWELIRSRLDSSREYRSNASPTMPRGGTLVVIPPNLFDHWKNELGKLMGDHGMRIVWLRRMPDFQKMKMSDATQADVVVVTSAFVQNKSYATLLLHRVQERMFLSEKVTRTPFVFSMARRALQVNESDWGLELLHWDRIVVDELHTAMQSRPILKFLDCLSGRIVWGMTATPSSGTDSLCNYRNFLTRGASASRGMHPLSFCTMPQFQERCIIRVDPPDMDISVETLLHRVTLTTLEKTLVSGASSFFATPRVEIANHQIQLCTYFDIKKAASDTQPTHLRTIEDALPTFKEVLDSRLRNITLRMRTLEGRRDGYAQAIAEIDARPNANLEVFQAERRRLLSLNIHNEQVMASKRDTQKKLVAMRGFVESRITGSSGDEEACCSVCLEAFPETGERALFICGHSVCHGCYGIMQSNRAVVPCPICRYNAHCMDEVVIIGPSCDGDDKVRKYGSKFVEVLRVLQEVVPLDQRVVLFTMWKSHAHVLKMSFAENQISSTLLMGTSHQRCSAIRSFEEGKSRVLICCIEGDAEGINLQGASHIFFTHALCGAREDVRNIENQCIGRIRRIGQESKVLSVHHFISRDTPEERVWQAVH